MKKLFVVPILLAATVLLFGGNPKANNSVTHVGKNGVSKTIMVTYDQCVHHLTRHELDTVATGVCISLY